jgi:hypothetical protein
VPGRIEEVSEDRIAASSAAKSAQQEYALPFAISFVYFISISIPLISPQSAAVFCGCYSR